jgi:hypothetical protein
MAIDSPGGARSRATPMKGDLLPVKSISLIMGYEKNFHLSIACQFHENGTKYSNTGHSFYITRVFIGPG